VKPKAIGFTCNKGLCEVEPSTSLILIKPACEGFTNHKGLGEFLFLILSCDTWMYNGKNHGYILKNGMPARVDIMF
jgi:hypothetical protein